MSKDRGPTSRKLAKFDVGYREGDDALNCGTCMHFKAEAAACKIVEGTIDQRFWCKRWTED